MNTPIHPNIGEMNGKALPVFAAASPSAIVIPPYVMSLAIPIIAQIIIMGTQNSLTVSFNKRPLVWNVMFLVVRMTATKSALPCCPNHVE